MFDFENSAKEMPKWRNYKASMPLLDSACTTSYFESRFDRSNDSEPMIPNPTQKVPNLTQMIDDPHKDFYISAD